MEHREACEVVARYFLTKLQWCDFAAVEVSGTRSRFRPMPHTGVHYDQRTPEMRAEMSQWYDDRRAWEKTAASGGGQLDVLGLTLPRWKPKRKTAPRIAVAEVKVSRSDLLSDLRVGKLLKYEPQATHCYLAITDGVFLDRHLEGAYRPRTQTQVDHLAELGLPAHWGIIHIPERPSWGVWPSQLRQPKVCPSAPEPTPERRARLCLRAGVSIAHRAYSL